MRNLHIGESIVLPESEVVGVFGNRPENASFLDARREKLELRNFSEKQKSFVVVTREKRTVVFYSKISSRKIIRRMGSKNGLNF
jgi:hypothetical protein